MASEKKNSVRVTQARDLAGMRIIGGQFRGRKLQYSGDLRTRPMKDRVREALFNLLGRTVSGKLAIDLFAGTGALALEALSRGAARAIAIELHRPTAQLIAQNAATLHAESQIEIVTGNTFLWAKRLPDLGAVPWVVFCSPPFEFYVERKDEMLGMLNHLIGLAPAESLFAVEADERFDFRLLPEPDAWDIRSYRPAVLGIWEKTRIEQPK